jgi:hypothetical protein
MEALSMDRPTACSRKLTKKTLIIENSPMVVLWILTVYLLFMVNWIFVLLFLIYIPISVLWFWRFICTHCAHYSTGCCPSGYGRVTARLFLFRGEEDFKKAFRRNISMVIPYWVVPLIVGLYLLYDKYPEIPMFLIGILIVTYINGFVLMPMVSKLVGCKDCPQRDNCPWADDKSKGGKRHLF